MGLSKRTKKFLDDTKRGQDRFEKRRKQVRNRIGPMSESESKAFSSPSRNVPKQEKKAYTDIPMKTQLDMMRKGVQRTSRRDFDNKSFAQELSMSPRPKVRKSKPAASAPKATPKKRKRGPFNFG